MTGGFQLGALVDQSASLTLAYFTVANPHAQPTDFTASIAWGDGSTSTATVSSAGAGLFAVTANHSYAEDGLEDATITVTDAAGSSQSTTSTVEVGNLYAGVNGTLSLASFIDTTSGVTASSFTVSINWGDGNTTSGSVTQSGTLFTVSGTHAFAVDSIDNTGGVYDVVVTITGGSNILRSTVPVEVTRPPEFMVVANLPTKSGTVLTNQVVALFVEPDETDDSTEFSGEINWGDGSSSAGTVNTVGNGLFQVSGSHTYTTAGTGLFSVTTSQAWDSDEPNKMEGRPSKAAYPYQTTKKPDPSTPPPVLLDILIIETPSPKVVSVTSNADAFLKIDNAIMKLEQAAIDFLHSLADGKTEQAILDQLRVQREREIAAAEKKLRPIPAGERSTSGKDPLTMAEKAFRNNWLIWTPGTTIIVDGVEQTPHTIVDKKDKDRKTYQLQNGTEARSLVRQLYNKRLEQVGLLFEPVLQYPIFEDSKDMVATLAWHLGRKELDFIQRTSGDPLIATNGDTYTKQYQILAVFINAERARLEAASFLPFQRRASGLSCSAQGEPARKYYMPLGDLLVGESRLAAFVRSDFRGRRSGYSNTRTGWHCPCEFF